MLGIYHEVQKESPKLFVEWKKNMEKSIGKKIKVLQSDNEGEYKSDPFLKLCRDEGMKGTSQ